VTSGAEGVTHQDKSLHRTNKWANDE